MSNPSFNITAWFARHPQAEVEAIINTTISDMKTTYGVEKIGGAGYWYILGILGPTGVTNNHSFGGKYVVRYLAPGAGLDAGFVAHTSNTVAEDYQLVEKPLGIAWGGTLSSVGAFGPALKLKFYRTRHIKPARTKGCSGGNSHRERCKLPDLALCGC